MITLRLLKSSAFRFLNVDLTVKMEQHLAKDYIPFRRVLRNPSRVDFRSVDFEAVAIAVVSWS